MSLIAYLFVLFFTGLVVGGLARFVLPGRDPMTIPQTVGLGLAGSFIAGLIAVAVFNGRNGGGIILSVLCTTLLVWLVRRHRERSGTLTGRSGSGSGYGPR